MDPLTQVHVFIQNKTKNGQDKTKCTKYVVDNVANKKKQKTKTLFQTGKKKQKKQQQQHPPFYMFTFYNDNNYEFHFLVTLMSISFFLFFLLSLEQYKTKQTKR